MKLNRKLLAVLLSLVLVLSLTACSSSKSYTFQIDNGEKIKVTLDTKDGYQLLQEDGRVTIQKEDEDILNGMFITKEGYEEYVTSITSSDGVKMIEATPEDAPTSYLYQFEGEAGTETTFLFKIDGAETGAIFGSLASLEEAKAAFYLLEFEKEK